MRPKKAAYLSCRICTTNYQMTINKLTKEVDVYCAWIDEAEKRNKQGAGNGYGVEDDDDFDNPENATQSAAMNSRPSLR